MTIERNNMMEVYTELMIKNLPLLRAAAGLTQAQLGKKLDTSRQTIVAIENGKRALSWSLYLAMVCVFQQYEMSKKYLECFELFDANYITR